MQRIDIRNIACKYTGIWQENAEGQAVSYGTVSWFEIGFTGENIVFDIKTIGEVKFYIDNKVCEGTSLAGNKLLFKTQDSSHTFKIKATPGSRIYLNAIEINQSEKVFKTEDRTYIQFIGDSITYKYPGYSSATGELLGADYSVVAFCGMSLKDGWGWYKKPDDVKVRPGMESCYFKLEWPDETYNFTDYNFDFLRIPDVLVIALGTNDYLNSSSEKENGNIEEFVNTYLNFVKRLRNKYSNARVYVLKPFNESYCRDEAVTKAYAAIQKELGNAYLIDSINWNVEISTDGTHPTDKGYLQIAENLAKELCKYNS